ncbi:MAG: sulfotransferase domain-containing protein [Desulfobacteraceae bacterium]|nr:sulfotransferase domain-containing protein [Desulfobacteraceae bacterium]
MMRYLKGVRTEKEAMRFAGKTVKIVASGMSNTDPAYVGKIILCLRNPAEILASQKNLASDIIVQGEKSVFSPKLMKKAPENYILQMGSVLKWIANNKKTDVFIVNYEELQSEKAESVLTDLCSFLQIKPKAEKLTQALAQIKPGLYRSKKTDWPETEEAALALIVYKKLRKQDFKVPRKS